MDKQLNDIIKFCKDAKYYMVNFDKFEGSDFGKILSNTEIVNINLSLHEILRSIEYKNGNNLFVINLTPADSQKIDNSIQLLINSLYKARAIELVYPDIFKWAFDGINIKGYAIVPSGVPKSNSTISRYGGTEMFMKILRKHLRNISNMKKGMTPDYNYLNIKEPINKTTISIGSVNKFNNMYSVIIDINSSYIDIIKNSRDNKSEDYELNVLDMKYWAREINPDFIVEAKHTKLKDTIPLDNSFDLYPVCIKNLMKLPHKGNYYRFLLARFLLSVHKPSDAKFIYFSVLSDDEREHVKTGNCSTQWNFIMNNIKRYDCPSCSELKRFCPDGKCLLAHPLEKIQKYLDEKNEKARD